MSWHHAPIHRFTEPGRYILTAGTYHKQHLFRSRDALDRLQDAITFEMTNLRIALEAWSIFSNHYHLIVDAEEPENVPLAMKTLHRETATWINESDNARGRRVWYQYWDTHLSFESSYLARLKYVQENPVKHGLVSIATEYPWCSAANFELNASPSFYKTVMGFKIDRVKIHDPWDPLECDT